MKISPGNSKLGRIPSINLPPHMTCGPHVPCKKDCYACKGPSSWANARQAWDSNYGHYLSHPKGYFTDIAQWIFNHGPKLFRWHTAGDIPDEQYLAFMLIVAEGCPHTKFLCFTKRHEWDYSDIPSNLQIIFSMWPGWTPPEIPNLPKAWIQDGKEDRIPEDAIECSGSCDTCGMCWSLNELGRDVWFHKH